MTEDESGMEWEVHDMKKDVKCVTHHICQCQAVEIEKLKMRILTYEKTTALRKDIKELQKAKSELQAEVTKCMTALSEAGLLLSPFVDSRDW